MKKLIFFLLCVTATSCSKTEKDFIGNYETSFSSEIKLASTFDAFEAFGTKKAKNRHTAKRYFEPSTFSLSIFEDQNSHIAGEINASFYKAESGFNLNPGVEKIDMSFDMKNFRVNGDTLNFSFENDLTRLSGKSMKGMIINNDGISTIALQKEFTGINAFSTRSPFYHSEDSEMIFYKSVNEQYKEKYRSDFYSLQVSYMNDLLSKSEKENEKILIENSIEVLKAKLN